MTKRPSWDEYFINFAILASTRSHDSQTKVGCVLVFNNRIIRVGNNGFCSGMDDSNLPTKRPEKYPYMVHAEENAISNMIIKPDGDITAYITHMPCYRCAKLMWQNGVRIWKVLEDCCATSYCHDDLLIFNELKLNGLKVDRITPSRSYLNNLTVDKKNELQGKLF